MTRTGRISDAPFARVPGLASVLAPLLALVAVLAPGPWPGAGVLAAQEEAPDTATSFPVPPAPPGPAGEERRYGPSTVLGCDLAFAVLAATEGEPAAVRVCPRAGGARDAHFFPNPILAPRHVDTAAVGPAGEEGREVVVRLTEAGSRELAAHRDHGLSGRVGVVVDGEVTAEFRLAAAPSGGDRVVALSGAAPDRAERAAGVVRAAAERARRWWGDRLWRFEWAPRPGGLLDSLYRAARGDGREACAGDDVACWRGRHRPREVVLDTVRRDPRAGASPAGVLAVRTAVRWDPDVEVAAAGLDLVFRPAEADGGRRIRRLAEWGYGVTWYVPARREGWVPIPGTGGWLDTAGGGIRGDVRPAEGDRVTLERPVRGHRVAAAGGEAAPGPGTRVPAGGYVVERTGDGSVWLREERPSEQERGCRGNEDAAPATEGPGTDRYRVGIPDLYRPGEGAPVIRATYPRGC